MQPLIKLAAWKFKVVEGRFPKMKVVLWILALAAVCRSEDDVLVIGEDSGWESQNSGTSIPEMST